MKYENRRDILAKLATGFQISPSKLFMLRGLNFNINYWSAGCQNERKIMNTEFRFETCPGYVTCTLKSVKKN